MALHSFGECSPNNGALKGQENGYDVETGTI